MSADMGFSKDNLNEFLTELGKEFRRLNGTKMPAEIILIGGAAVLANYGFRKVTYDIDAVIRASSAMKQAINNVGDKLNLPNNWLNADFVNTGSYSEKITEVSVYYRQFSNILTVRTVSAEYLLAMKLMSGREYKHDLSDVAGILLEHKNNGNPISRESIENAISKLYGDTAEIPEVSIKLLDAAYVNNDYEFLYEQCIDAEEKARNILMRHKQENPDALTAQNIRDVLKTLKEKDKDDLYNG
jgi:hypothetical protein